jgi:hypothetical protein
MVPTCLGVREAVAALPCRAAVLGREDAGRRDSNPQLSCIAWIRNNGVQHQPGSAGVPAIGRGMIGQTLYPYPIFTAVRAGQKARWFGAGVERTVRVTERPDLSECVGKRQRFVGPADHLCEIGIVGGKVIHLPLCETSDFPTRAAIFAAPDARAVPIAAAPRPKGAGLRVSNYVIDWPAVAVRTLNGPAAAVIAARNQKCALGGADEKRHARRRHQGFAPHSKKLECIIYLRQLGAMRDNAVEPDWPLRRDALCRSSGYRPGLVEWTLKAPCRRATGIRIGDFAGAIDKALRQRRQRPILDCDKSDRRGRRRDFER